MYNNKDITVTKHNIKYYNNITNGFLVMQFLMQKTHIFDGNF